MSMCKLVINISIKIRFRILIKLILLKFYVYLLFTVRNTGKPMRYGINVTFSLVFFTFLLAFHLFGISQRKLI